MNLDHDFAQVNKLSEDQKKRSAQKMEHIFFPKFKWTPTLRCTSESNYCGGAYVDHTQTTRGDKVKLLGDIPHGFGTLEYVFITVIYKSK